MIDINKIYVCSDQHYSHNAIIKYCNRSFSNIIEMNNNILEYWNNTVNDDSIIYNLGDVAFGNTKTIMYFLSNIKGKQYLAIGNHDKRGVLQKSYLKNKFADIQQMYIIETEKYLITMCHYPFSTIVKTDKTIINLHGHSHSKTFDYYNNQFRIDVGFDAFDYKPVKLTKIIELVENFKK